MQIWIFTYLNFISYKKADENLTEEERAAAWKEFENEKKGFMANFDSADMQGCWIWCRLFIKAIPSKLKIN